MQPHAHQCLEILISLPPAATATMGNNSDEDSAPLRASPQEGSGSACASPRRAGLTGVARPTARGHMSRVQEKMQGKASRCGRLACCSWGKSGDTFHTGPTRRARTVPRLSHRRAAYTARTQPCRTALVPACMRYFAPGRLLYEKRCGETARSGAHGLHRRLGAAGCLLIYNQVRCMHAILIGVTCKGQQHALGHCRRRPLPSWNTRLPGALRLLLVRALLGSRVCIAVGVV